MEELNAMAPALRPDEGAWPDDALTLTYAELRQLVALHLDQLAVTLGRVAPWDDARRAARAMRDGETPLRVSEVLGHLLMPPDPEPEAHPGLAHDPTVDGVNLGPRRSRSAEPDHDHTLELVVPGPGIVRCTGDRIDWEADE